MSNNETLNILDFGNSKIRFSIFDKKFENIFSESSTNKTVTNVNQNLDQIIKSYFPLFGSTNLQTLSIE